MGTSPILNHMKLALFDLDGTVTRRDTLLDFVRFALGWKPFLSGVAHLSPYTTAFTLGVLNGTVFKEIYLSHFFNGWPKKRFQQYGLAYAVHVLPLMVKPDALDRIKWHKKEGHRVIIVTASIKEWIEAWCKRNDLELISSEIEFQNGKVTGRLASRNCSGKEKVRRIKDVLDLSTYEKIYAYGDSNGDKEMLAIADETYYRHFKYWSPGTLLSHLQKAH